MPKTSATHFSLLPHIISSDQTVVLAEMYRGQNFLKYSMAFKRNPFSFLVLIILYKIIKMDQRKVI